MTGLGPDLGFVGGVVIIRSFGPVVLTPIVKEQLVQGGGLQGLVASDFGDDGMGEPERRFLLWPMGATVRLFVFVRHRLEHIYGVGIPGSEQNCVAIQG